MQLAQLRAYAKAHNWRVVQEYVDRAPAVNVRKRTAWTRLIKDVQAGEVVAVWRLDRAFRSVMQAAQDVDALKSRGVTFASTTEGFDLTTNVGRLLFDMLSAFAAFERRVIGERIKAGKALAKAQGRPIGGFPLGMKRSGERGAAIKTA